MELENEFTNLSIKFLFVCENSSELNSLLNDLNSLDYKYQQISNSNVIVQFIDSLPKIPTTSELNIITKSCNLVKQLINKQKINLPVAVSNKVINWIIQILCFSSNSIICEALDVLTILFKKNSKAAQSNIDLMVSNDGILLRLLKSTTNLQKILVQDYTPQEVYKTTLGCIESILMHLEGDDEYDVDPSYLDTIGKALIKFLYTFKQNEIQDGDFMSIVTMAINSLKFITHSNVDFATNYVGELIGICKAFMLYGINNVAFQQPVKIISSQQAVMEPISINNNKRGTGSNHKNKKQSKSGKKRPENSKTSENKRSYASQNYQHDNPFSMYRTSDSDFSDNEHSRELVNRNKQSKLRLTALSLIYVMTVTVDRKILFGYWHSLLSTDESMCNTLINCLIKDTSPRCKIVALQTIIQLIKYSKPFLVQAENKDKAPSTFTPFSVTLGNMITFSYEKLTQAMIKEGDLTVLTQILKCISMFVTVTPFHRLKTGIVTGFIKYVRLLTRHKDPTIRVAALIVMNNLISLQDMTSEIYEMVEIPKSKIEFDLKKIDEGIRNAQPKDENELIDLEYDEEIEDDEEVEESVAKLNITSSKMSWLLQNVLENLGIHNGILKTPSIAISVRIESLQVLSSMSSHFLLVKDHLLLISTALTKSLSPESPVDEKLYASRTLESLGSAINNFLSQENKTPQDVDLCLTFWIRIIPAVFDNIQNVNQSPTLRAYLADSLANIGVFIFEKLDTIKQIQLKSILTGCCYDEDSIVKSSAVRALAVYVLFPSLREDLCFIENTTESVLRIIKDQNVVARTKASFGLANVVDGLLIIRETVSINDKLFKEIVETCLQSATDNDRVKVNAVRTLGNLIILLKESHLGSANWLTLFEKSIQVLNNQLTTCNNVKVKWNVCYSFSSMMKNPLVFEAGIKVLWQQAVFNALCNIIETSPNFKVRTNACLALTTPQNRKDYEKYFWTIWNSLLIALEQSNNLTDFNEYKHRDALQDQLCTAICHFLSLAAIEDVIQMKNHLFPLMDVTKQNWDRVINRLPPESHNQVINACNSIKNMESNCKNSEQKNSIGIILSCFQSVEDFAI
ncbi:HEAT repeat-containing protein 6 [Chironomus tepperi]|uniref:HEAT repeat-containing protein 6 n=1 Tax=Chironomus tepperi TaxID=113505 RepID=UPI00391F972D